MQVVSEETDEQAWDRIGGRTNYRCGYCVDLVEKMRTEFDRGGPTAAMDALRSYRGMVCSSVEWMLWPAPEDLDPGSQAVS